MIIIVGLLWHVSTSVISQNWTNEEIAKGLQDYLICIEMFFASFAITYAFTYKVRHSIKWKCLTQVADIPLAFVVDRITSLRMTVESGSHFSRLFGRAGMTFHLPCATLYRNVLTERTWLHIIVVNSMPHDMFIDIHRAATGTLASQEYLAVKTEDDDEEFGL